MSVVKRTSKIVMYLTFTCCCITRLGDYANFLPVAVKPVKKNCFDHFINNEKVLRGDANTARWL